MRLGAQLVIVESWALLVVAATRGRGPGRPSAGSLLERSLAETRASGYRAGSCSFDRAKSPVSAAERPHGCTARHWRVNTLRGCPGRAPAQIHTRRTASTIRHSCGFAPNARATDRAAGHLRRPRAPRTARLAHHNHGHLPILLQRRRKARAPGEHRAYEVDDHHAGEHLDQVEIVGLLGTVVVQ